MSLFDTIFDFVANPYVFGALTNAFTGIGGAVVGVIGERRRSASLKQHDAAALKQSETNLEATYVKRTSDLLNQYGTALTQFRAEAAEMRGEIRASHQEMGEMRATIGALTARLALVDDHVDALNQHIADLSSELRKRGIKPPPAPRLKSAGAGDGPAATDAG
jgi:chromosome segregation ATPase